MATLLKITGMHKGYSRGGDWMPVFENVSFEVLPGEIVAIIGGRLEGKTTLLKVAAGISRPDAGTVELDETQLVDLPDRAREVRWIDRDGPGRLDVAISRFVGWPLAVRGRHRRGAELAAADMLRSVGAGDCFSRHWSDLSNSERVLVSVARGFAGTPKLVVIDDLLDALGEPLTQEVSDLVRTLVEQSSAHCGVLMSTSDMASAMFADRVLTITGKRSLRPISGRLTNEGSVVSLRKADG